MNKNFPWYEPQKQKKYVAEINSLVVIIAQKYKNKKKLLKIG